MKYIILLAEIIVVIYGATLLTTYSTMDSDYFKYFVVLLLLAILINTVFPATVGRR